MEILITLLHIHVLYVPVLKGRIKQTHSIKECCNVGGSNMQTLFFQTDSLSHLLNITKILTTEVLRFLNLEAGPRGSFVCGGCVRANSTSSGRKSLWRDVGNGFVLSIARSLLLRSGSLSVMGSTGLDKQKKIQCKIVNIFLPISFNICFGCSKEPSN